MEPALAVAALRGLLLRDLAAHSNRHFEGLAQAARYHKEALSSKQKKKMIMLDHAYSIARHYTQPRFTAFHQEICRNLSTSGVSGSPPSPPDFPSSGEPGKDAYKDEDKEPATPFFSVPPPRAPPLPKRPPPVRESKQPPEAPPQESVLPFTLLLLLLSSCRTSTGTRKRIRCSSRGTRS